MPLFGKLRRKDIYQNSKDRTPTTLTFYLLNVTLHTDLLKIVRGNPGKRRIDLREPTPPIPPAPPAPPGFLMPAAKATAASAQQTTIRDPNGQITGTVSTDSNGQRTFRDGSGRMTGTANTDSNGTTTFRDAGGRTTDTATAPRR